jgi:hypothetical protein
MAIWAGRRAPCIPGVVGVFLASRIQAMNGNHTGLVSVAMIDRLYTYSTLID